MNILYITNSRLPTAKAYGINIVKTCEALIRQGARLTLVVPQNQNKVTADLFSYYGLEPNFSVRYLYVFDAVSRGWPLGFWFNQYTYSLSVIFFVLRTRRKKDCIILSRDELSAGLLRLLFGYTVFYDMHGFPERRRFLWKLIMRSLRGIIVTNRWKREQCKNIFRIPEERIHVASNGFDPSLFKIEETKEELRKELGLPLDHPIVMYTGHLYDWKGAHVLLEAAHNFQFPISNFQTQPLFVFVGGNQWDIESFKEEAQVLDNVLILGHKPYTEIPRYLKAADVLVLPNSQFSKQKRFSAYSQYDTSPIKLFEYMASGTPIVASDLPSIREITDTDKAFLVPPDDTEALADGLQNMLQNKERAATIARRAKDAVHVFTWDNRAEQILSFIRKRVARP